MAEISFGEIKSILPHRPPMLLVDAVRSLTPGDSIVAVKSVTGNESCYTIMRDDAPAESLAYPCSLIIESFCQAAGILYNHGERLAGRTVTGVMLFGAISDYTFESQAFPGDTLEHRVQLVRGLSDAAIFSGETWVGNRLVARVEHVVVALRPAEALA